MPRTAPEPIAQDHVLAALHSGGDSRLAIDPATGTNKYLCPPGPGSGLLCFSSCTASPLTGRGMARAEMAFGAIMGRMSPALREAACQHLADDIEQGLLRFYGIAGRARVVLCPSGTDALLLASRLVAAETPGARMTAILPEASETGTGVKLAATCRQFDGPGAGAALSDCQFDTIEIALRRPDGTPRPEAADADYAAAVCGDGTRKMIILTHGSKTGLVAPGSPPPGAEIIVDACQARLMPEAVAAYLGQGWPVAVTGSKFFGGPAFSGALLLPDGRFPRSPHPVPQLGTLLRWAVALEAMAALAGQHRRMAALIDDGAGKIGRALAAMEWVVPIDGARTSGPGWGERASIFTFAVRDAAAPHRLLSQAELWPVYQALARRGLLLGQPVGVGRFGGLRIAFGADDLTGCDGAGRLEKLFAAIAACTDPAERTDRRQELALT